MDEMDENTIKVLARFTEIGEKWPIGAWFYVGFTIPILEDETGWCKAKKGYCRSGYYEVCELEANQKGVYRTDERDRYEGCIV